MINWEIIRNSRPWVARCRSLKVTAQGDSWEDLHETAHEITRDVLAALGRPYEEIVWEKALSDSALARRI